MAVSAFIIISIVGSLHSTNIALWWKYTCKPFDLQAVKKKQPPNFFCFVFIPSKHTLQTGLQQERSDVWTVKHGTNIDDIGHSHFACFGRKILLKGTIRSLLSVLSSRQDCLCAEMRSLKYRLCFMSSPVMSNRQRHSLCCSETQERAERDSKYGKWEGFEILQFTQNNGERKNLELLFFFIFFQLKRLLFSHRTARQLTCGFSRRSQRNQQWNA